MTTLEQEVIALAVYQPITVEAWHRQLLAAARLGEARMRERCANECRALGTYDAIRALKSELP